MRSSSECGRAPLPLPSAACTCCSRRARADASCCSCCFRCCCCCCCCCFSSCSSCCRFTGAAAAFALELRCVAVSLLCARHAARQTHRSRSEGGKCCCQLDPQLVRWPRSGNSSWGCACTPAQPPPRGEVADVCWRSLSITCSVHYLLPLRSGTSSLGCACTPAQPPPRGEVADVCWRSLSITCSVHYLLPLRCPPFLPARPSIPQVASPSVPTPPAAPYSCQPIGDAMRV